MASTSFTYPIMIFDTSPERVYTALTSDEDIKAYMLNTGPKSTWRVGDPVLWKFDSAGEFDDLGQRVVDAIPGERLTYTWHRIQPSQRSLFSSDADYEAARAEETEVSWTLSSFDEGNTRGTLVTLTHSGFDSPNSVMYKGVTEGWVFFVSLLKTHLEVPALVTTG